MTEAAEEAATGDGVVASQTASTTTETADEIEAPVSIKPAGTTEDESADAPKVESSMDAALPTQDTPDETTTGEESSADDKETNKEQEPADSVSAQESGTEAEANDAEIRKDSSTEPAAGDATTTVPIAESPGRAKQRASLQERINSYSTETLRDGPLPSIEECLFGIPRDVTQGITPEEEEMAHFVPLNLIRRVASQGIDDDEEQAGGSFRALTWRVLLGFLPPDRRKWTEVAEKERESYHSFVQELFCIEDRDISGAELRGHHSKRHTNKHKKQKEKDTDGQTKKERRESKKERREARRKSGQGVEETSATSRAPVKFMDDSHGSSSSNNDSNDKLSELASSNSALEGEDGEDAPALADEAQSPSADDNNKSSSNPRDNNGDKTKTKLKLSSADLLHDDPSQWNMSVREQKILERLTNHEAVNQLLVKRDCKAWNNFLENATLLDEIRKDVNRTHPHLYFYLEPEHQLGARRYGALERILFVWAKLNKGVRYVQGMNELVGTLYYVLANDFNEEWADHAEADTYILFAIIMSEMRDIFVSAMDTADTGLVGRIENMQNLLHLHDPQVRAHFDELGIDASFYAVRWLTTLLSREFLLPDTIRLWDSMFASTHKENFLRYVCVAMVIRIREDLLKADFSTSLTLLQKYPSTSMDELLDTSRALWIYESQITMACLKGGLTLHQALQAIPPPDKVVMAFGLPGGVAMTDRERLEQAGHNAKEAVKNKLGSAKQGLSSAGQGILGGARRFIQNRTRAVSNDSDAAASAEEVPSVPRRLPFRNFSFGNRSNSAPVGGESADLEANEKAEEQAAAIPLPSDVDTLDF